MNRVLFEKDELTKNEKLTLTGRRARHLLHVLKVRPGSQVKVGQIDGPYGLAKVDETRANEVLLSCQLESAIPVRPPVDLLLALPRPKVLKRLWAPLASLGVGHIALTNAWKVERNYFDCHHLDPQVHQKLLLKGLEQAGDTRLPRVSQHRRLTQLVEKLDILFPANQRLLAHPQATRTLDSVLPRPGQRTLLAVGPEGGWIDREVELLQTHGFNSFTLGKRILKTETACSVLLGLIHSATRAWA